MTLLTSGFCVENRSEEGKKQSRPRITIAIQQRNYNDLDWCDTSGGRKKRSPFGSIVKVKPTEYENCFM